MTFKNINTATNQILGRVAGCQHHAEGIRNSSRKRSIYDKPLEFDIWFNRGLEVYKKKGYKFQWLNLGTLKVTLPNGKIGSRTYDDFFDEWQNEYKAKYYL